MSRQESRTLEPCTASLGKAVSPNHTFPPAIIGRHLPLPLPARLIFASHRVPPLSLGLAPRPPLASAPPAKGNQRPLSPPHQFRDLGRNSRNFRLLGASTVSDLPDLVVLASAWGNFWCVDLTRFLLDLVLVASREMMRSASF
jgi:hypothetical protein